jgi:hypothetical protein
MQRICFKKPVLENTLFEKQDRRIYDFIMAHAISGVEDV